MPKMFKGRSGPFVAARLRIEGWPDQAAEAMARFLIGEVDDYPSWIDLTGLPAFNGVRASPVPDDVARLTGVVSRLTKDLLAASNDLDFATGRLPHRAAPLSPSNSTNDERDGMPPKWEDRDGSDPISEG